ncbi:MAG: hypothetical protein EAX96_13780 [Candidatus Lokiarchaeota archaeon]|nr:hypothetical protein [Candidatus Lokiarchaeota archaeon]
MEKSDYFKYGLYLLIISAIFSPFLIIFFPKEGNEVNIFFRLFGMLCGFPLIVGISFLLVGYIIHIMNKMLIQQQCPNCGAYKLKNKGFLKIYCEGCKTFIQFSSIAVQEKIIKKENQNFSNELGKCPECGSALSIRNGEDFCPFCERFF